MQLAPDLDLWASLLAQRAGLEEQPPSTRLPECRRLQPWGMGRVLCPLSPLVPAAPNQGLQGL